MRRELQVVGQLDYNMNNYEGRGRGRGTNIEGAGRYQTSSREGGGAVDTYNDYANFIDMSPK